MKIILVIDVGTSSMRGVLYSENGHAHKIIQETYSPEYLNDNCVEQDPLTFKKSLISIVKQSVNIANILAAEIIGISITSQRSSMIALDSDCNPLVKLSCGKIDEHFQYALIYLSMKIIFMNEQVLN